MRPKRYAIKEIFLTLQGEGYHSGQAAVFCRFSGCNLWSGLEQGRASAACRFCDTDFVGIDGTFGGRYTASELVDILLKIWEGSGQPMVVFTGGEPLLQLDTALIEACKQAELFVAVETNGTKPIPEGLDWVCISPKPRSVIVAQQASEIKLVYPQPEPEVHPSMFEHFDAEHFFLQPLDDESQAENQEQAMLYCLRHPQWRLSIQMQKILGVR